MKANHNTIMCVAIDGSAVLAVSKVLNLKANHNVVSKGSNLRQAVLAVPKVLNLGSGCKSL